MSGPRTEIVVKERSDCGVAISGGTSGIGLATAEAFVSAGVARIALFGRNQARGAAAVAQLKETAPNAAVHFIQADCMSVKSADAAVREAEAQLQGIDVLVNSIASNVVPELLARKVATMADLGVPDAHDQAQLVVFLAGPQAARLTGQAISLNGGVSAA